MASTIVRKIAMAGMLLASMSGVGLLQQQLAAQKKNADANTRSVQGVVTDASGAGVAGSVVQLKNTKSLQIRSFIAKDQGEYYFNGLSPDVDYELHAMFNGASSPTKTLSSFDGKKQAILNLKLDK